VSREELARAIGGIVRAVPTACPERAALGRPWSWVYRARLPHPGDLSGRQGAVAHDTGTQRAGVAMLRASARGRVMLPPGLQRDADHSRVGSAGRVYVNASRRPSRCRLLNTTGRRTRPRTPIRRRAAVPKREARNRIPRTTRTRPDEVECGHRALDKACCHGIRGTTTSRSPTAVTATSPTREARKLAIFVQPQTR